MSYQQQEEKKGQKKDILYHSNKYVNSDKLRISKKYIFQLWVNRILTIIVFTTVLLGSLFFFTTVMRTRAIVDGKMFTYVRTNEIDIGNKIIYTNDVKYKFEPVDILLAYTGQKSMVVGEVIKLPHGLYSDGKLKFILDNGEYAVKCIYGECPKDSIKIINESRFYGVVLE